MEKWRIVGIKEWGIYDGYACKEVLFKEEKDPVSVVDGGLYFWIDNSKAKLLEWRTIGEQRINGIKEEGIAEGSLSNFRE